jgi:pimeloyl-ACP methyl ester carboxylesterase
VVLVHGGPGLSSAYLTPWFTELADTHRVVAYDMIGCGNSAAALEDERLELRALAEDLEALLRELSLDDVTLVGHSFGALVAVGAAKLAGSRVARLALVAPPGPLDKEDRASALLSRASDAQLEALASPLPRGDLATRGAEVERRLRLTWPLYFARRSVLVEQTLADLTFSPRAFFVGRASVDTFDGLGAFASLATPTWIAVGRHDWLSPPRVAERWRMRRPNGTATTVFGQSGHLPFAEEPARFLEELRRWLASRP